MNTKLKGDLGELKVASDLVSQGYTISIPFGDNSAYDLILDKNNSLYRVQIKYVESNLDFLKVRLSSVTKQTARKLIHKPLSKDKVDLLAVYDRTDDICYYIPLSVCEGKQQLTLRKTSPKNNQKSKIFWAKDYLRV